jgi:TetR/AcrR family transcriptional regulator, transcriptional repressor for nem operon
MQRPKYFDEKEALEAAVSLFWRKGYNATSMQDLVDCLGLSRSSIYDTYGNKHALFLKALESYIDSITTAMNAAVRNTTSAKRTIRELIEISTKEMIHDAQHKGCFFVNSFIEVVHQDPEGKDLLDRGNHQIEDIFFKAIKAGQEAGEILSRQNARALARFIFNSLKGMRVSVKSETDKKVFSDIIKLTMSVLE